ncbi:F0F1 ATP synthase subunit alpha [Anaerocaecibacter muris]|uniref:F0F1 ATP synthase subunit alpha n=1 Tax=Anaerocaecibacter muris TaxID=2941513 RepID=UPI00203FFAF4|nr:F0F1 ATP synthase subunit alpha [Anaerocaecibacter muris]
MVREIDVTSATELSSAQIKKIEKVFLSKHKGENVEFVYKIDKELIGGILVVDGDKYYDGTVRSQIDKINTDFKMSEVYVQAATVPKRRKSKPSADSASVKKTPAAAPEQLNAENIKAQTEKELSDIVSRYNKSFDVRHAGSVEFCGDGVIMCNGLSAAEYGEMLQIENGAQAIVLSLSDGNVGAIVLDDEDSVSAHMLVKTTGMIVSVPVGDKLLGRVVNPLGKPVDGLGEFTSDKYRPIEAPAPAIKDRDKVNTPMLTGLLAVDSMIPIGKGQRELIIGDRQTGKTSIAVDTILNQKGKGVICIYVAIGQKSSTVSSIVNTLTERGAMEYTVIVSATARDSAPLQYIAPYAGCAIAEEFMYAGKDVLIVYDDLSKHAVAYRAMSLLLKRPPGREAYPGDIFYLHSRLLERAAKLSPELGGGSITALPIVETLAGDISAYIPTNIISITDGQIYLESELFNAGIRPAINVGLSVSRVGGSAQTKAMRKVSGKLRLDLSQYRELAVFAQFGADLDDATARLLEQGKRTTEIIKQDVHSPMSVEQQIILLYVTTKQLLKDIPVARIAEFKDKFIKFFDIDYADVVKELRECGEITMDMGIRIEDAVNEFALYFLKDEAHE